MSVSALAQVALVNVDLSTWSGYKRTSDEELAKIGVKLPKNSPLTKGGKKIYPTEFLKEFTNIRKEISRKLSKFGVRALGGTAQAVPEAALDTITDYLNEVKARTTQAIVDFESNYDVRLKDYLKSIQDPVVKSIISGSALKKDEAVSKFGIEWQVFKIVPAGETEESSKSLVSGMTNTLLEEVSQAANKIYESSFIGKPRVTQKALHQVRALRDKMAGLSFLDPENIDFIVHSMDQTFSSLPASGWVDGKNLDLLTGLLQKMEHPEKLLQHAAMMREGMAQQASQSVPEVVVVEATSPETTATVEDEVIVEVTTQDELSGNLFADEVVTAEPVDVTEASPVEPEVVIVEPESVSLVEAEAVVEQEQIVVEREPVEVEPEPVAVEVVVEVVETEAAQDESFVEEVTRVSLQEIEQVQVKPKPRPSRSASFF